MKAAALAVLEGRRGTATCRCRKDNDKDAGREGMCRARSSSIEGPHLVLFEAFTTGPPSSMRKHAVGRCSRTLKGAAETP